MTIDMLNPEGYMLLEHSLCRHACHVSTWVLFGMYVVTFQYTSYNPTHHKSQTSSDKAAEFLFANLAVFDNYSNFVS